MYFSLITMDVAVPYSSSDVIVSLFQRYIQLYIPLFPPPLN